VPYVFQLETRPVSHQRFTDFAKKYFVPSNLKIGMEAPKASRQQIFIYFFEALATL